MWNLIGAVAALAFGAAAWRRSQSAAGGFYDEGVYGMSRAIHRRYALAGLGFAIYFSVAFALHAAIAGLAGFAVFVLIAILYASSFIRGASDYHE
jgi:hypothetical protein